VLFPRIRRRWVVAGTLLAVVVSTFFLFPGRRLSLAFTIATGIGTPSLQARIDALEEKAIRAEAFSADEREFLVDFYRTLATGAKLTIVVGQTGRLLEHYLDGSGTDYRLAPEIFSENRRVREQIMLLAQRASSASCSETSRYVSPTFYMPDPSKVDSVFGLYHGTVVLRYTLASDGRCVSHFRAEVPWSWPSYASLRKKYGHPHAESFPLPNLETLLFGRRHALYVDNGLGEHLVTLGLAKPFLAFSEWEE
jgi:hypothetical protein